MPRAPGAGLSDFHDDPSTRGVSWYASPMRYRLRIDCQVPRSAYIKRLGCSDKFSPYVACRHSALQQDICRDARMVLTRVNISPLASLCFYAGSLERDGGPPLGIGRCRGVSQAGEPPCPTISVYYSYAHDFLGNSIKNDRRCSCGIAITRHVVADMGRLDDVSRTFASEEDKTGFCFVSVLWPTCSPRVTSLK